MNISPETHALVGDIAYRLKEECDSQYKVTPAEEGKVWLTGDLASYYVSAMLRNVAFFHGLQGIGKQLDALEKDIAPLEKRGHQAVLRRGLATFLK